MTETSHQSKVPSEKRKLNSLQLNPSLKEKLVPLFSTITLSAIMLILLNDAHFLSRDMISTLDQLLLHAHVHQQCSTSKESDSIILSFMYVRTYVHMRTYTHRWTVALINHTNINFNGLLGNGNFKCDAHEIWGKNIATDIKYYCHGTKIDV